MSGPHQVYVIDDDPAVRDAIATLVESIGLRSTCFASADEFLARYTEDGPACVVTDICLPGTDGVRLQEVLNERAIRLPLIAVSAHGDIAMAVEMVRRGAVDFIEKPFRNHVLLQRVHEALQRDIQERQERAQRASVEGRQASLTPRERDVLPLLMEGLSNKRIAARLDLSPRTVETHRANVLHKMQVDSVTALLRLLSNETPPLGPPRD